MRNFIAIISLTISTVFAQNRFPKPDFESGYQYPTENYAVPAEDIHSWVNLAIMVLLMSVVAWAVHKKRVRTPVIAVSLVSVLWFGFIGGGCICSVGAVQNVALALTDSGYTIPLVVFLFFLLPIIFTLIFGRVFCSGVCPLGALQELVNVKNYRLSRAFTTFLGIIPWFYLAFAVLFAITESGFLICRFDPFAGIFRLGGDVVLITIGVILLLISIFVGRPFCRFLCPYGAVLSLFSRVSFFQIKITGKECINCDLCRNACPVDAILPPNENCVKESRMAGIRRIILYSTILPAMIAGGALAMHSIAGSLAKNNKTVAMNKIIAAGDTESVDAVAFYGRTGEARQLQEAADEKIAQFRFYSLFAGGFLGFVVALTLISLSLKRSRAHYQINHADCVACGRCFGYCPQNKKRG